jgi:hypothetical protein
VGHVRHLFCLFGVCALQAAANLNLQEHITKSFQTEHVSWILHPSPYSS